MLALKGPKMKAQGNALGSENDRKRSPEGARQLLSEYDLMSPLQGLEYDRYLDPGRCPGLSSDAPLGLETILPQSLRDEITASLHLQGSKEVIVTRLLDDV
jgi:hypothetical protein